MALSRSKWYLINIKARENQTPQHYYQTLLKLKEEDPLISIKGDKAVSFASLESNGVIDPVTGNPYWIVLKLMSYTIIDKNGFYDRREKKDISIEWNDDWVTNKKEAEMLFCISNHTLAVKKSSRISLKTVLVYFQNALEKIEPETYDVSIITDKEIIDRIKNAHAIMRIEADISFGNPGHSSGFRGMFDMRLRECNPTDAKFLLSGTKTHPLNRGQDSLIDAVVDAAQRDGTVKARIQEHDGGKYTTILTSEHPRIVDVEGDRDSYWVNVWNTIKSLFRNG